MGNIRLVIEFDGAAYAGWQFQPNRPTVQGEVEAAVRRIAGATATVYGCGRTDAGVSARRYVANFHTDYPLTPGRWRPALNHHLPNDIHVVSADEVASDFHSRHRARSKTYVYRLVRGLSPLRRDRAWELRFPVDAEKMRRAARLFAGTHEFGRFCHAGEEDGTCTVFRLDVREQDDEITVTVQGDRFLYKMVRRIVGAMVSYGMGRVTLRDLRAALAGNPRQPFQTAPARGLALDSVDYGERRSR